MAKRKRKHRNIISLPNLDVMAGGPEDTMGLFMQYIVDSHVLADEPEFIDFRFNQDAALASIEKTHKKHASTLRAAEKKGGEELEFLQDDMRIEAIDRLLTPPVRRDIQNRLNLLVERVKTENSDLDQIMMATIIQTLIEENTFPWGMINLIAELFQRSLDIPNLSDEEIEFFDQLESLIGEDLSMEELLERMDDPAFKQELEAKIDLDSELYKKIAQQSDKISDEFINAIWHGEVDIEVFTEGEILSYFDLLQERFEAAGLDPTGNFLPEGSELLLTTAEESIEKIVTPRRIKAIEKDLRAILKTWLNEGNIFASPLSAEISYINQEPTGENTFIRGLFIAQVRQALEETAEDDSGVTTKPKRRRRRRRR